MNRAWARCAASPCLSLLLLAGCSRESVATDEAVSSHSTPSLTASDQCAILELAPREWPGPSPSDPADIIEAQLRHRGKPLINGGPGMALQCNGIKFDILTDENSEPRSVLQPSGSVARANYYIVSFTWNDEATVAKLAEGYDHGPMMGHARECLFKRTGAQWHLTGCIVAMVS